MKMLLVSVVLSAGLLFAAGTHAQQPPAGSTATCKDGSNYSAASKRGACSGHGGVKEWHGGMTAAPVAAPKQVAIPRPAVAAAAMASSASATCKDGSSYSGASKRGACSGHGGVKDWNGANAAAPQPMAMPKPMPATTPVAASAPMAATATCKDGSSYSGTSKRGACSGHGGVKNWGGSNAPMPATPAPMAATRLPAAAPMATTSAPMSASTPKPAHQPTAMPTQAAAGAAPGSVWVNTSSKVYHCSNDKWYGKTKQGAYMSEFEARSKGFRAEHGKSCS